MSEILIHKTKRGVEILVSPGKKSANDFMVKYREPKKRIRTPKHIHLVVDLFMKRQGNRDLTKSLLSYILTEIIDKVQPITQFPPRLQIFKPEDINKFELLNQYGEYELEFLLVVTELIMIQEKTNYPNGVMNRNLFQLFYDDGDIFSIVSAATFR